MFRVIETFRGIGSQAKALTRIGRPFEIVNTADWDINAILAYCLIHKGKIDINKYADISDEDVTNFLKGLSLSSDGKKPMSDEAFRRMPMHLKRRLYAAIKETRNIADISQEHSASTEEILSITEEQNNSINNVLIAMDEIQQLSSELRGIINN